MSSQIIQDKHLGEQYIRVEHPSGLTMLLYPMPGFSTTYAMFSTQYGSVDTCFQAKEGGEQIRVPEGIAHYLEHKMFESEDGDAFDRYAKTGAAANAFTSFDKTCYLFTCSGKFQESLEILLDCVTHPYFTKETVEKEQGIIGQEIRMYEDDPSWRVTFNLLDSLYHNNSVKVDIAGTIESIARIDADLLYRCYNTFYNLHNMVLTIAGNFDPDEVLQVADRVLKKAPPFEAVRRPQQEPESVVRKRVVQHLPVALPMFYIGFKSPDAGQKNNFCNVIFDEMLLDIITGETTELYRQLYNDGLINGSIYGETMAGRDYLCSMVSGESRDPDEVYRRVCSAFEQVQQNGIDPEIFQRVKKATYGRYLGLFSRPDSLASAMTNCHFAGISVYDLVEMVANCTRQQLEQRLREDFSTGNSCLSIVMA